MSSLKTKSRIERLRKIMRDFMLEAILISNSTNVSYIVGFKTEESFLLVSDNRAVFITDFRYYQQLKSQALKLGQLNKLDFVMINGSLFETIGQIIKRLSIKKIGFEAKDLTVAMQKEISKHIGHTRFIPTYDMVETVRLIKDSHEIELLRKAVSITKEVFEFVSRRIRPGVSEKAVALEIDYFARSIGAQQMGFDVIVAEGRNSVYPHAVACSNKIKRNDSVMVDMGVTVSGYNSDLTRMFFLGKMPSKKRFFYSAVLEAQAKAFDIIAPKVRAQDVDKVVRDCLHTYGIAKFFGHSTGHGIGMEVHEAPSISRKSIEILEPGMVFSIEPAVYIPGSYGLRVEDMVLVTEKGCEVLTADIPKYSIY